MNAHVFAEGSGTTSGETSDLSVQAYYKGGFLTVSGLADALDEYGETTVHVLSEQFGYVTGDEPIEAHRLYCRSEIHERSPSQNVATTADPWRNTVDDFLTDSIESNGVETSDALREAREALLSVAESADVVVVLLTSDGFRAIVNQQWEELVEAAKPESIWCLAAARNALGTLDLEQLESKGCEVLTYQRVGVARIDTETREQLLHAVEQHGKRARQ